jgi:hypothetical protein
VRDDEKTRWASRGNVFSPREVGAREAEACFQSLERPVLVSQRRAAVSALIQPKVGAPVKPEFEVVTVRRPPRTFVYRPAPNGAKVDRP